MTADRACRARMPVEEALRRLIEGKGTQFDPAVADACERFIVRELLPAESVGRAP